MPDIIKEFFDTFEIKPYDRYYNCKANLEGECKAEKSCCACENSEDVYCYPEITDTHYLTMLAILTCCDDEQYDWRNLSELRKTILEDIMSRYSFETHMQNDYSMKEIIQELFKGE